MPAPRRSVDMLPFTPSGSHTRNASLSSAVTLTAPAGASLLMIQATGQNVLITLDGTTPTASVGFTLFAGDPPSLVPISEDTVVKAIQVASGGSINYLFGGV